MQKLLIHITILFALIMLLCTPSAYGEGTAPSVSATYTIDPMAVDLGLPVYWSKCNRGAESSADSTDAGRYYQFSDALGTYNNNPYWRKPNKDEVTVLINGTNNNYTNNVGVFLTSKTNGLRILIPVSGYKTSPHVGLHDDYALFWTSSPYTNPLHGNTHAFRFKSTNVSTIVDAGTLYGSNKESASATRSMYLPFRPVIDKVTLIYKISESKNNTTSEMYSDTVTVPKGTKVKLTSIYDDCHTFLNWTKNGQRFSGDDSESITVTVDENDTYQAIYQLNQYTVTAAPNDGSLGYIVDTISGNNLNPPQTFDVNCGNWITFKARPTDNCISLFRWADDRTTPTVVYTPGHNDEDYSCTTDSNGVNTLIIYNVNKTIPHLYAVFVGNADSTKVESDGGGSASIKVEDGSNICDEIVTLTATAKECYKFSHWTKDTDDNWSGTSSQFTLSPVTEIATYTAHFIQVEEITVTIISEDKNKGTVAFDDGNNEENNQQE